MNALNSPLGSRRARTTPRPRAGCICLSLSIAVVGCSSTSGDANDDGGRGAEAMVSDSRPGDLLGNTDVAPDLQLETPLIDDRLELSGEVCTSTPESDVLLSLTSFIVTNPHATPDLNRLLVDTDGDGVADETELEEFLASENPDTDGDGYSDLLELRQINAGFDPTDPSKPVHSCPLTEHGDRDGDGLVNCDEEIVGTDITIADSDRDRIPDGIEYWFGSDPTSDDSMHDSDFDTWTTGQEIRYHSNPAVADLGINRDFAYTYALQGATERVDRSKCYPFKVGQVRLVTTKARAGLGSRGYNEVIVLFGEGPADDPMAFGTFKAACVRARYVLRPCEIDGREETCGLKDPADGKVVLRPEDFLDLAELARRREAARTDPSADPCIGVPAP